MPVAFLPPLQPANGDAVAKQEPHRTKPVLRHQSTSGTRLERRTSAFKRAVSVHLKTDIRHDEQIHAFADRLEGGPKITDGAIQKLSAAMAKDEAGFRRSWVADVEQVKRCRVRIWRR